MSATEHESATDPQLDTIEVETVRGYADGQETIVFFGVAEPPEEDYIEAEPDLVVERSAMR